MVSYSSQYSVYGFVLFAMIRKWFLRLCNIRFMVSYSSQSKVYGFDVFVRGNVLFAMHGLWLLCLCNIGVAVTYYSFVVSCCSIVSVYGYML